MVYPGRPSHGCLACIARKVKCDEAKPQCMRCQKREQPCPGYRNPRDVKFVRMTGRNSARSTDAGPSNTNPGSSHATDMVPSSSEPSAREEDITDTPVYASGSSQHIQGVGFHATSVQGAAQMDPISKATFQPTAPLRQNFGDQAICFFFHQYIMSPYAGSLGHFPFLPDLYKTSEPNSALALSVKAISFATLSARSSIKILAAESQKNYVSTLNLINAMLQSPEETKKDTLIVAILLLVLFENVTREKPGILMNHSNGLRTLLILRGEDLLQDFQGWAIFRHVLSLLQIRDIERSDKPSLELLPWIQSLDQSIPNTKVFWQKFRISQIRAAATEILKLPLDSPDLGENILSLLYEARDLDAEVAVWSADAPPSWQYRAWRVNSEESIEVTANFLDASFRSSILRSDDWENTHQYIFTYTDVWFSSLWHTHLTARLILNETIIRLARRLELSGIVQESIPIIQELLFETCASIPFAFGDVRVRTDSLGQDHLDLCMDYLTPQVGGGMGAYSTGWSLRHVVTCEFTSPSQMQTATDALIRLGTSFGIKQAFLLANRRFPCSPKFGSPSHRSP